MEGVNPQKELVDFLPPGANGSVESRYSRRRRQLGGRVWIIGTGGGGPRAPSSIPQKIGEEPKLGQPDAGILKGVYSILRGGGG